MLSQPDLPNCFTEGMGVYRSQCGEQFMESVNRCWNCGQSISGTCASLPPIRTNVDDAGKVEIVAGSLQSSAPSQTSDDPFDSRHRFRGNCAISSLVVGVLTVLSLFLSWWIAIPAMVGMVLGILGLSSNRRKTAAIGLLLCFLVFAGSTIRGVVGSYQQYRKHQQSLYEY